MFLTIIVFYAFMVRCLKRENKIIAPEKSSESTTPSVSSSLITSNTTSSSSTTTSIAYNKLHKSVLKDTPLSKCDKEQALLLERNKADNSNDSGKEPDSGDEGTDDNNFDEEEFYNIIATKAAAFQSKRNSSTSVSSGSFYDDAYRTKRNSLRSQSSTCSEIIDETTAVQMSGSRRSSEDRIQNRKLSYKNRRIGWKRRRTTGRY